MHKKILPVSLLLLSWLFTSCSTSPRITQKLIAPSDSAINAVKYDVGELEKKYPKQSVVFLSSAISYEHSGRKEVFSMNNADFQNWQYHIVKTNQYVIMDKENPGASLISLNFWRYDQLNNIFVITKSPSGKIQRFVEKDFTKNIDENKLTTLKLNLPEIEKGTFVEHGYDLSMYARFTSPTTEYNFDVQKEYPIENLEIRFLFPEWWNIQTKKIAAKVPLPIEKDTILESNKQIFTYKNSMLPVRKQEPYAPYYREVSPYIQLKVKSLSRNPGFRDTPTWDLLARDFERYVMDNDGFFSTSVGSKTRALTENETSPFQKMKKIVTFIQQNIKVADDYVYRNFPDILEAKKGSTLEICGLTYYMLKKSGLDVDYLLIHSSNDGYFDPDYISFSQFDMPAVRVSIDNSFYIVFPYNKFLPVEQILDELTNETALVISKNNNNGKRWIIPDLRSATDSTHQKVSLKIERDGKVIVTDTKIFHGSSAYAIRSRFADLNHDEKEKGFQKYFTSSDLKISDFKYEIKNLEEIEKDLVVELTYSISNLVTITPEEILFQTGGLLSPVNLYSQKIDTTERINPIEISHTEVFAKDVTVFYPEGWGVQTILKDTIVQNKFGSSTEKFSTSTGVININQNTRLEKSKGEKSEISLLFDIINGDQRRNLPVIVFNSAK